MLTQIFKKKKIPSIITVGWCMNLLILITPTRRVDVNECRYKVHYYITLCAAFVTEIIDYSG